METFELGPFELVDSVGEGRWRGCTRCVLGYNQRAVVAEEILERLEDG